MKSTRWQFTLQYDPLFYADLDEFVQDPSKNPKWKELIAEIGWQDEIAPTTGQHHRQGYLRTVRQCRMAQVKTVLPTAHLEIAKDWLALKQYCCKKESRDPSGNVVKFTAPQRLSVAGLLIKIASYLIEYGHVNPDDHSSPLYRFHDDKSRQYWVIAGFLLEEDPELAGLIGQPLPQNLWKNTRATWINLALAGVEGQTESISITDEVPKAPGLISEPLV